MNKINWGVMGLVLLNQMPVAWGADSKLWVNSAEPATLIELFTSEGCSSCPPADKYLSKFQSNKQLWQHYIPLAFHVDYWNYLGWEDKFSHPSFTQRQRLYRSYGAAGSVYTPGFFVDGKEWQGYFTRSALPVTKKGNAMELRATLTGNEIKLSYADKGEYIAHIVLLAMDESTTIKAGENRGKQLEHDFVVLEKQQSLAKEQWHFTFTDWPKNADAIAVWLTKPDGFDPVQTVAGYL